MKLFLITSTLLLFSVSCQKDDCQTCTKTIGGFSGNTTEEIRRVCDDKEAEELEESSSGTTVWTCE